MNKKIKKNITLIYITVFFHVFASMLIVQLLPFYAEESSSMTYGLLVASFPAAQFIGIFLNLISIKYNWLYK